MARNPAFIRGSGRLCVEPVGAVVLERVEDETSGLLYLLVRVASVDGSLRPAVPPATAGMDEFPLAFSHSSRSKFAPASGAPLRFAPAGAVCPSSGRSCVTIGNANKGDTAMTDLVNFIRFNEDNSLSGNIASLAYDIDILGEAFESTNAKAPVYRLFTRSPRGRRVEIGGIWKRQNQNGGTYLTLAVNTGHGTLNANLGRYPGQDDEELMAVIPWG